MDSDFQLENLIVVLPVPSVSLHPMQTRSKSGIIKKKTFASFISISENSIGEPTSFKAASRVAEWQATMQDEIDALHTQHIWDSAPLPPDKNLIGCKWVYRIKKHLDGSIAKLNSIGP
ncbi:uncharacterized mitochondrial protein AtMg00820-like [Malus domestica]|uniref:uncharacterized mitochondrial protein AtMg00820-like n=1 Tax=Malus domestica TaxID=3750 RepID=UPI003976F972